MTPPVVVSIAATDSGGAAGLAADLATFAALGVHGAAVVTAITAQDTLGIRAIHEAPLAVVDAQLAAVLDDLPVAMAKTGMLGSADIARLVADRLREIPLVVDPVLRASTGSELAGPDLIAAYRRELLPRATVVTPNLAEARVLAGDDGLAPDLASRIADRHGCATVITGGPGEAHGAATCIDWLALPGQRPIALDHPSVSTANDHGTGCTFASALAAHLAHGSTIEESVRLAGIFTTDQLTQSRSWQLGRGRGPIAHLINQEST